MFTFVLRMANRFVLWTIIATAGCSAARSGEGAPGEQVGPGTTPSRQVPLTQLPSAAPDAGPHLPKGPVAATGAVADPGEVDAASAVRKLPPPTAPRRLSAFDDLVLRRAALPAFLREPHMRRRYQADLTTLGAAYARLYPAATATLAGDVLRGSFGRHRTLAVPAPLKGSLTDSRPPVVPLGFEAMPLRRYE